MRETITITPRAGQSAFGPTFGSSTTSAAYLEPTSKRFLDAKGQEMAATLWGCLPAGSTIEVGDTVTWDSRRYEVIGVDVLRDMGRTHHIEIYLKSSAGTT
jgi:plastocyanin